jgi:hypothetical protein
MWAQLNCPNHAERDGPEIADIRALDGLALEAFVLVLPGGNGC